MGPSAQSQPGTASPGRLASWVRQGVESFAAAQRILLDLTAQQNALAIGVLRERMPRLRPVASLIDMGNRAMAGLAGAGDILLDLAAGETALAADGVKEVLRLGPAGGAVADIVRHRTVTLIEMQRRLLDGVAAQMQEVATSYEEGKGLMGGASIGELARRAMEGFVETEKKFLDLVAEEVDAAVEGAPSRKPARDRSKVLTQLAREGVEKYIDAQKELLEFAIHQFSANGKTTRESARAAKEELRTSFAELTRKSVKNFVNAEKSLLEVAVKPPKRAERASKGVKTRRKARPRKPPAAKGAAAAAAEA